MRLIKYYFSSAIICSLHFGNCFATEEARAKLLEHLAGDWVSRGIYAVTKLEIPDLLANGPKSIEELALLSSTNPDSLNRILNMLAGYGLFEEVSPGVFDNTDSTRLLAKAHPDTLYGLCLFYGEDMRKAFDELAACIQTGTTAFELSYKQPVFSYFKENPARAALFHEAMKEKSRAVIQSALTVYDFGRFNSLCDVGGGHGQFATALLQKHPQLSLSVLELPEVIERVKPENSPIEYISGDFFGKIPERRDAYLLKSVLHDWDDAQSEIILKNCHRAMPEKGRLLIVEIVLQPKSRFAYANCMDVLMLAITGGKERRLSSFESMLDNAGFILEKIYPTSTEFSILEARKK